MDASVGLSADEHRAIEWDCQKLSMRAFNLIDAREFEALGELYTEDAVFVRPTDVENPFQGREAIVASYAGRPANRMSRHFCSNFEIGALTARRAFSWSPSMSATARSRRRRSAPRRKAACWWASSATNMP